MQNGQGEYESDLIRASDLPPFERWLLPSFDPLKPAPAPEPLPEAEPEPEVQASIEEVPVETVQPITDYTFNASTNTVTPIYGTPQTITGFRLVDSRASYGFGLETFILGYPMHFDWSWRTLFNKAWEDYVFATAGGSAALRKAKFSFWIGYDW